MPQFDEFVEALAALTTPGATAYVVVVPPGGPPRKVTVADFQNPLVTKALYNANTVLAATTDDQPAPVVIGEGTILGRLVGGSIAALTVAQVQTMLGQTQAISLLVTDPDGAALAVGDAQGPYYRVPSTMNGKNLVAVAASLDVASTAGVPTIQIHRLRAGVAVDMLSTKLTIDANENDSATAAAPAVINLANDDVLTADRIYIDIDVAGAGAKGLYVELIFG